MIPGMATSPAASITVTPSGAARPAPTALILPCSTRIEPLAIVPRVTVKIVAFWIRTLPPVCTAGLRSSSSSVATSMTAGVAGLAGSGLAACVFDESGLAGSAIRSAQT